MGFSENFANKILQSNWFAFPCFDPKIAPKYIGHKYSVDKITIKFCVRH